MPAAIDRRTFLMSWGVAGALLLFVTTVPLPDFRATAAARYPLISAVAIAAAGAIGALARKERAWLSAGAGWGVAYCAAWLVSSAWPERFMPAQGGSVLVIGEIVDGVFTSRSTSTQIEFWRHLAAVVTGFGIAGALEGFRRAPAARRRVSVPAMSLAWLFSLATIGASSIVAAYGISMFGDAVTAVFNGSPRADYLGNCGALVAWGAICGMFVGSVHEWTIRNVVQRPVKIQQ